MTMRAETKIEGRLPENQDRGFLAVAAALTPEQFDIVQTRASAVPPRWRERFLRAVGDQLALAPALTSEDVLAACGAARRAICVGIGPPSM
jgi:hypothetical protein